MAGTCNCCFTVLQSCHPHLVGCGQRGSRATAASRNTEVRGYNRSSGDESVDRKCHAASYIEFGVAILVIFSYVYVCVTILSDTC